MKKASFFCEESDLSSLIRSHMEKKTLLRKNELNEKEKADLLKDSVPLYDRGYSFLTFICRRNYYLRFFAHRKSPLRNRKGPVKDQLISRRDLRRCLR